MSWCQSQFPTHLPLMPHICVNELGHHWFSQWLVACSAPSHYLNQWWLIVNWTPGNKFQWNLNRNSFIFSQENALENVVWKMSAILSPPQCVKPFINLAPDLCFIEHQRSRGWCHVLLFTWLSLGLHPANERRRYFVTTSLIGWAQT